MKMLPEKDMQLREEEGKAETRAVTEIVIGGKDCTEDVTKDLSDSRVEGRETV